MVSSAREPLVPGWSPWAEIPRPQAPRRTLRPRLGVSYGLAYSGRDLGLQHGPGIVSGIEFVGSRDSLVLAAAFDRHFPQNHTAMGVDLKIQSNAGWLLAGWRRALNEQLAILAAAGPGLALTRVAPEATVSSVTPESSSIHAVPWVRTQVGFELGSSPLVAQISWVTDVSLYSSHFDVIQNATNHELVRPWMIRPGVTVVVLWR